MKKVIFAAIAMSMLSTIGASAATPRGVDRANLDETVSPGVDFYSIGRAKNHLAATAKEITKSISGVSAYVSVNKALVTQSSSAIPIVPLYISILYKVMKEQSLHEGCIEQMYRMFAEKLYGGSVVTDDDGLVRMDDWEMRPEVQEKVSAAWTEIGGDNLSEYADLDGYRREFNMLFGFDADGVDYEADTDTAVGIESLV